MDWRVEIQCYLCERLVLGMAQLRHPFITLSYHCKTHTTSQPVLTIPAGLCSYMTLIACSHGLKSWNPMLLVWETFLRYVTAQTQTHHSHISSQDAYYISTSVDYPFRFRVISSPVALFSWTEELKSNCIGVRDLSGALNSSDTYPSLSHTHTRLILHLNQCWLSLWTMGSLQTLISYYHRIKSWNPMLLVWETCWGAWYSSGTRPSLSHSLTRLILHPNQCWLSLQVWVHIWPWYPVLMDGRVEIQWWHSSDTHPFFTLSHPYKTHTLSQPVLTIPAGSGSNP